MHILHTHIYICMKARLHASTPHANSSPAPHPHISPFGCLYSIALCIVILHPTEKAGKKNKKKNFKCTLHDTINVP